MGRRAAGAGGRDAHAGMTRAGGQAHQERRSEKAEAPEPAADPDFLRANEVSVEVHAADDDCFYHCFCAGTTALGDTTADLIRMGCGRQ